MTRRPLLLAVVGGATLACATGPSTPDPPADGWEVARAVLVENPRNCFQQVPAYCIDDPAFVDPILQEILDRSFDGQMPTTERAAGRVANQGVGPYRSRQLVTADARALVQARMEAWYEEPDADVEGQRVFVDLGVLPGEIEKSGRSGFEVLDAPFAQAGEWRAAEMARRMKALRTSFSSATEIEIEIDIPAGGGGYQTFEYIWQASHDWLVVHRSLKPNEAWYTDPLADRLDAIAAGEEPLQTADMHHCTAKESRFAGERGCPL